MTKWRRKWRRMERLREIYATMFRVLRTPPGTRTAAEHAAWIRGHAIAAIWRSWGGPKG